MAEPAAANGSGEGLLGAADCYGGGGEVSRELFAGYSAALLHFASACCVVFVLVGVPGNLITIVALCRCKKTSSRDDEDEENVDSDLERTSIDASPIAAVNSDTASAETSAASRKIFSSPVRRKRAKTQDDSAVVIAEACNVLKSLDASRHNRDEYDKFGEYVGSKIRNLKTDYAKFTIQHEITTLLYHADLGRYNQTNAAASPLHTNVLEGNSSQHAALCTPANVVIVDATHEHPDVLNDEVINEVLISEDCSQLQHQYGHLLDVCRIRENETK